MQSQRVKPDEERLRRKTHGRKRRLSNDMIYATYKLAVVAMIEGAVLLLFGIVYGFAIMMVGTIWKALIDFANDTEGDDEDAGEEADAGAKEIDKRESA